MRTIELLAPAKNAECGIEAIRHGADAVYIGAGRFGARAAAGNSVADIARLVEYAHLFKAKVYVTVNTILSDSELPEAEHLIHELYEAGVDALIIQDMGLMKLNLPPIELHASTQMDNCTVEKVRFLHEAGFEQIVLARELSLDEIKEIHRECPDTRLEVFVHGALCVSYSGRCYISESGFRRSANRGECAQVCRMEFDLEDADGKKIIRRKHLLSLKDLCQIDSLEDLLEAGASSFKIEGRLKDTGYVKNVTAAYSRAIDAVIKRNPDKYVRASSGQVKLSFTPDVAKSFNRGFTHYFLYGRNEEIFSFDTPKAMGEFVGKVKDVYDRCFTVAGTASFSNGDGLCFIDENGHQLHGFRVNKTDNGRLYPLEMPRMLRTGTRLYRNFDQRFDKTLSQSSAERFIPVDISVDETEKGFCISMSDDDGCTAVLHAAVADKELARSHQKENIERQLSKLGGTPFKLRSLNILYSKNWFLPSSLLGEWKRQLVRLMTEERMKFHPLRRKTQLRTSHPYPTEKPSHITYLGNVMNNLARAFYTEHGVEAIEPAFEIGHPSGVPVMFCRHCLRYSMGWCPSRQHRSAPYPQPFYLSLANGKRFRLEFDCKKCIMKLINE
ncbi:MAG: U32 family peptidase [Bacteroides sp.]|nr:U32 family peptidase [Roseburia sp.]MCM1346608.1 U32 family peptidase [Bacteroides sp.]MCM1421148.1 U32 family peptidase [Bacteroides sp.]